jgi:hypothetical protein
MKTLKNPALSFLQFGVAETANDCIDEPKPCLPVMLETDLKFQLVVEFTDASEAAAFVDQVTAMRVYNSAFDELGAGIFKKFYYSSTKVLLYWDEPIDFETLEIGCDSCFYLGLTINDGEVLYSNRLCRICDGCYSTVIEYSCDEDAYDFLYCDFDTVNRVRLPFYLKKPQLQDEETVYVKSRGAIQRLKSVTKKEFEGVVEMLPFDQHEKLKAALSHDNVWTDGKHYTGGISKSAAYEIGYIDFMDLATAPASFKAMATPYNWRNSNCADCGETYDPCVGISATLTGVEIEAVNNGNGTQTFTITFNPVVAATMTISSSVDGIIYDHNQSGGAVSPRTYTIPIGLIAKIKIVLNQVPSACNTEFIYDDGPYGYA